MRFLLCHGDACQYKATEIRTTCSTGTAISNHLDKIAAQRIAHLGLCLFVVLVYPNRWGHVKVWFYLQIPCRSVTRILLWKTYSLAILFVKLLFVCSGCGSLSAVICLAMTWQRCPSVCPSVRPCSSHACSCGLYVFIQIVGAVIAFILLLGVSRNEGYSQPVKKQPTPFYVPPRQDGDRSGDRSVYVWCIHWCGLSRPLVVTLCDEWDCLLKLGKY
jgi:hypothetical protein